MGLPLGQAKSNFFIDFSIENLRGHESPWRAKPSLGPGKNARSPTAKLFGEQSQIKSNAVFRSILLYSILM